MPILFKWSSLHHLNWFKNNELLKAKIFIDGGVSLDYLFQSKATIIDLSSNTALSDYMVTKYRNRINYEFILQILSRFKVGRNYLNIGFTGSYMMNNVVNQKLVGSDKNMLFSKYGIRENNYKLICGSWTLNYEWRFSRIKKKIN